MKSLEDTAATQWPSNKPAAASEPIPLDIGQNITLAANPHIHISQKCSKHLQVNTYSIPVSFVSYGIMFVQNDHASVVKYWYYNLDQLSRCGWMTEEEVSELLFALCLDVDSPKDRAVEV